MARAKDTLKFLIVLITIVSVFLFLVGCYDNTGTETNTETETETSTDTNTETNSSTNGGSSNSGSETNTDTSTDEINIYTTEYLMKVDPKDVYSYEIIRLETGHWTDTCVIKDVKGNYWNYLNGELTLPAEIDGYKVVTIADYAFNYRNGLTGITVPEGVTTIGAGAFENCSSITYANLPSTLEVIGNKAFSSTKISKITLPENLNTLGSRAFYNVPLTEVTLASTDLANCGELLFYGFENGLTVTIKNTVTKIPDTLFFNTKISKLVFEENSACESIGNRAFAHAIIDENLRLPNSLREIGENAFANCSMTEVTFGSGLKSIGVASFYQCHYLNKIDIGGSVASIGKYAFSECTNLKEVNIGNGVTTIGEKAFNSCSNLKDVTIGTGDKKIGNSAFANCQLESVRINSNITNSSSYNIFLNSLNEDTVITFGESVKKIPYRLFFQEAELAPFVKRIEFNAYVPYEPQDGTLEEAVPDYWGTEEISPYAFFDLQIGEIEIPSTVIKIDGSSFCSTRLTNITVNENNQYYKIQNGALINTKTSTLTLYLDSSSEEYTVPSGIKEIGKYAFYYSFLKSITLPNGLEKIEHFAFCDSNITEITFPASVKIISVIAFRNASLTSAIMENTDGWYHIHQSNNKYVKTENLFVDFKNPEATATELTNLVYRDGYWVSGYTIEEVNEIFSKPYDDEYYLDDDEIEVGKDKKEELYPDPWIEFHPNDFEPVMPDPTYEEHEIIDEYYEQLKDSLKNQSQ